MEHVVEVGDVADGEPQDLDLGELLVRRQRRQKPAKIQKGRVEGLDADPLPGRVGRAVLQAGSPLSGKIHRQIERGR